MNASTLAQNFRRHWSSKPIILAKLRSKLTSRPSIRNLSADMIWLSAIFSSNLCSCPITSRKIIWLVWAQSIKRLLSRSNRTKNSLENKLSSWSRSKLKNIWALASTWRLDLKLVSWLMRSHLQLNALLRIRAGHSRCPWPVKLWKRTFRPQS